LSSTLLQRSTCTATNTTSISKLILLHINSSDRVWFDSFDHVATLLNYINVKLYTYKISGLSLQIKVVSDVVPVLLVNTDNKTGLQTSALHHLRFIMSKQSPLMMTDLNGVVQCKHATLWNVRNSNVWRIITCDLITGIGKSRLLSLLHTLLAVQLLNENHAPSVAWINYPKSVAFRAHFISVVSLLSRAWLWYARI
jgi:hypothetical protein